MTAKILVTYASATGSTAEVAASIGNVLREEAVDVDVTAAEEVNRIDDYSAVVLGSSIRLGRWLDEAVDFLERFRRELADRPTAYFMTCMSIINTAEGTQEAAMAYWDPILFQAPEITPVGLGLFAGSLAPELGRLPIYQDTPFGDYRDWETIENWARIIRPDLMAGKERVPDAVALAGAMLSFTDMSGFNLSRFDFQAAEMIDAKLRQAELEEANLRLAVLEGADLSEANLHQAHLGWANLSGAQCQKADFSHAVVMGGKLEHANLAEASFAFATMNGADLKSANLSRANLEAADLNWADLREANLSGASLKKAHLGWANFHDVTLDGTDFSGARYNSHTKWPAGFNPAESGCVLVDGELM